jgi:hypothetical protein
MAEKLSMMNFPHLLGRWLDLLDLVAPHGSDVHRQHVAPAAMGLSVL